MDRALFDFINRDLSNPVFDLFFPFWTDVQKEPVFFVFLFVLLIFIIRKKNWRLLKTLLAAAVTTFAASRFNYYVLKEIISRPRPINSLMRILPPATYSFPSGHTVSAFALAVFLSLVLPRYKYIFLTMALLSGFARIYVGVHYPSDVAAGALVGGLIAYLFYRLLRRRLLN